MIMLEKYNMLLLCKDGSPPCPGQVGWSSMAGLDDKETEVSAARPEPITFKRAGWKHFSRWFLFVFVVGLNVSMPMSLVERLLKHVTISPGPELVQFLFLLGCDLYFVPVCVFEVNSVKIAGDEMEVATLLWKAKLTKKDIVSLKTPNILTWALLRTRRLFYLINRVDIPNFDQLAALIGQRYLL